jgi:hypothetical protein
MSNSIQVILSAVDQLSGPLGSASKKLDDFGAKAEHIGRKLESAGLRIGALGAAANAGLSKAGLGLQDVVGSALDTEKALLATANTAGIAGEAATKMVGKWKTALNDIAQETNQSQDRINVALQDLVSRGLDPDQAFAMLRSIGKAATATGADISDMARSSYAAIDTLGIAV